MAYNGLLIPTLCGLFGLVESILSSPIGQTAGALRSPARVIIPTIKYEHGYTAEELSETSLDLNIEFDDGAKWVARVSLPLMEEVRESEISSMRVARDLFPIPQFWVSEFDYVSVLFVDRPLAISTTPQNMLLALADFYIALSKRPYTGVGSLTTLNDKVIVSQLITPSRTHGVFPSTSEAHIARLDDMIDDLGNTQVVRDRLNRFCLALEARELVRECEEMKHVGQTFLRHHNLEKNLILTENGLSVSNWEYACTAPWLEAFALPRSLLDSSYASSNKITAAERTLETIFNEKGARRLAAGLIRSRKYHRLHDVYDCPPITVESVYLLRQSFNPQTERPSSLMSWRKDILRRYAVPEVRQFVGNVMGLEDLWYTCDVRVGQRLVKELKHIVDQLDFASRPHDEAGEALLELAERADLTIEGLEGRIARIEHDGA
ncbi:hypothetical protein CcaverHIS641_0501450 [Cutaneotrichosporon cavernicola]|nr:hypothetical protein CcaverHIS641_0501450 [Cutaneotrichosporon cavernicola]